MKQPPYRLTRFPPPFGEVVEKSHSQAVDLAYGERFMARPITVARQHRTCTGFAFQPTHPGVGRLKTAIELTGLYAWLALASRPAR